MIGLDVRRFAHAFPPVRAGAERGGLAGGHLGQQQLRVGSRWLALIVVPPQLVFEVFHHHADELQVGLPDLLFVGRGLQLSLFDAHDLFPP